MPSAPRYRRVLLKLSGEGLMGSREYGLDPDMVAMVAQEVKAVHGMGVQVCLVIGGGNIFRGVSAAASGMDRAAATTWACWPPSSIRWPCRARWSARAAHPRPVGDPDDHGVRALHPPPRGAPYGEGPRGDLRRRHRQSVLHHRHRRGPARGRDGRRCDAQGHAGRRRLFGRSAQGQERQALRRRSATWTCCRATCRSWTPRRSRLPARTVSRSSCSTSTSPAHSPTTMRGEGTFTIIKDEG